MIPIKTASVQGMMLWAVKKGKGLWTWLWVSNNICNRDGIYFMSLNNVDAPPYIALGALFLVVMIDFH